MTKFMFKLMARITEDPTKIDEVFNRLTQTEEDSKYTLEWLIMIKPTEDTAINIKIYDLLKKITPFNDEDILNLVKLEPAAGIITNQNERYLITTYKNGDIIITESGDDTFTYQYSKHMQSKTHHRLPLWSVYDERHHNEKSIVQYKQPIVVYPDGYACGLSYHYYPYKTK